MNINKQKEREMWPHELGPFWFVVQKIDRGGLLYYCPNEDDKITTSNPKDAFVFTERVSAIRVMRGLQDAGFHIRLLTSRADAEVFTDGIN